jgi:imidazolonepropionase-like amidohydrolase
MIAVLALALFTLAAAQPPAQLVIANVRVFTGERSIERATITVADGKIVRITADAPVTTGVTIDGAGKTALPGLIDSHIHVLAGATEAETRAFIKERLQERLQSFLRHGVTTVKSVGDATELILKIRQDLRDGTLAGPRLLVVGPVFTAPGGHPAVTVCSGSDWCRANLALEVDSEQEARRHVRRLVEAGVDAIKLVHGGGNVRGIRLEKLRPEVMKAIVAEARSMGVLVTAHVLDESSLLEVLAAGVSGVEHGPFGPPSSNTVTQAFKNPERSLVPTFTGMAQAGLPQALQQSKLQAIAEFYKAGVPIVVGTDTTGPEAPGLATVQEVETFVKAGVSEEAALKAATSVAARHLGQDKAIGTLEAGMSADILLVRGNPLTNIADLHQVDAVVQRGKVVFRREP